MASVGVDLGLFNPGNLASLAKQWGGWALGFGSPSQQILANTVIFLAALLSSAVSLGATLVIAALAFFWFWIGVLRLVPQVNAYWPLG